MCNIDADDLKKLSSILKIEEEMAVEMALAIQARRQRLALEAAREEQDSVD